MNKKVLNTTLSVLFAIALIVFTITLSISLPIYFRPFYYMHIKPLDIPYYTGYDYQTIKHGYDQVLNYLTLPWDNVFKAGVFKYSTEGASHFADCKKLFNLNAVSLLLSVAIIVTIKILEKKEKLTLDKPKGLSVSFYAGISTLSLFVIIAIVVAVDFDSAFTIFHTMFFPGKDNWLFDPRYDEIITALPQQFFMNSAILIVLSILLISLAFILIPIIKKKKAQN